MQTGAVYIVDDDIDDHHILKEIWKELNLPNQLLFFSSARDMMDHLTGADRAPFLIICDVNLPQIDGFELRQQLLDKGLKKFRSVPFIYWSNHASEAQITRGYDLSAHGFFIKGNSFEEMKNTFKSIINYWSLSKMPKKN